LSIEEKIRRLQSFVQTNPALGNVPFIIVAGRPTTPSEALASLRARQYTNEIMAEFAKLGFDPPAWELCQDFYRRLAAASPTLKIATLGFVPPISPAEALVHVQARDEVGTWLVKAYGDLLSFMALRAGG